MQGRKVRVGIIGAGDFAEVCHIPGINAHPLGEVVALCARNRERVTALAARCGVPDIHTDYQGLLAREDIDAVTIAGPDALHGPATFAALAAGKHVFCEKPLAMDAAEAERMVEACAQSGRVGMVSYTFRYGQMKFDECARFDPCCPFTPDPTGGQHHWAHEQGHLIVGQGMPRSASACQG